MDFDLVARELVRAVRGKRSQTAVNRRLGYAFNQVHRWERGQTRVKWSDFVALCAACRVDLKAALVEVIGFYDDPARGDLVVANLIRPASMTLLQRVAGLSRTEVAHWVAGRVIPRLEHVLLLLEVSRSSLLELASKLVEIELVASLAGEAALRAQRRDLLTRHPNLEVVVAVLELEGYRALARHDDAFVAARAGLPVEETRTILAGLVEVGTIALRRRKYVLEERWQATYDLRGDFGVITPVKLHWMKEAARALEGQRAFPEKDFFSYYVFNASDEVAEKVTAEYADFLKRVIALVTTGEVSGEPRHQVRVLGVHVFRPGT
jgi:hypothetical protein